MNRHSEPNKQNGRHLPLKSAKPTDKVCRNYVWGKCTKYAQCKFSHECDIETMKNIIQFCHDFQNPTGCNRHNCTYIHATSAEEKLFREAGQIPADLAKRYAHIDANFLANNMPRNHNYTNNPPPPPPETQPPPPPPPPTGASVYQPRWYPMLPPPPPPPREPPQNCPPTNNVPVYTHQQQPPPHMPFIDTSRPPPPLPTNIDQIRLGTVKRTTEDTVEAGPSKARKTAHDTTTPTCENCTQWDIRNLLLDSRIQKKVAEKAMLVLKIEKERKECNKMSEFILKKFGTMATVPTPSTSASISPSKDMYDIVQAIISNCISDVPELPSNTAQSNMLRFLSELLSDSEGSISNLSSSVLNNELETFFKTESSLNLDTLLSLSSSVAANSSALPSTSVLGPTLSTPTHLPPPQAHSSHQNFQPLENQLQYSYNSNLSNGAGESTLSKMAASSAPSVPMPTATLPPPYISQSNYHYNMMGRPPPFQ